MSRQILNESIFHVARLVLETQTPLSIGAGGSNSLYDNLIVRDANGLPAIPGSSLAGVLRALYFELYGKEDTAALFGYSENQKDEQFGCTNKEDVQPSRIQVSWGYLHDCDDKPIEDLRDPRVLAESKDKLIQDVLPAAPLRRDHVKLNHRGVSYTEKHSKFDRTSLTAGHRFSVELSLWSETEKDDAWNQLLDLLHHPAFRLGGNTRRGLGKVKVVRCAIGCFKLCKGDDNGAELARFNQLSQLLGDTPVLLQQGTLQSDSRTTTTTANQIELYLKPVAEGFRFGGLGETYKKYEKETHSTPLIEKQVYWSSNGKGAIQNRTLLFSATSFKGALSHRVAYYYNLLTGVFVDDLNATDIETVCANNAAVRELFGYVEDEKQEGKPVAQVGCLLFDDIYLTKPDSDNEHIKAVQLPHSGIDRFTGGVREGVLYFEELILHEKPLPTLTLTLTKPKTHFDLKDKKYIEALELALDDLCNGRLALGAGSGRGGYGYFTEIKPKRWLGEEK